MYKEKRERERERKLLLFLANTILISSCLLDIMEVMHLLDFFFIFILYFIIIIAAHINLKNILLKSDPCRIIIYLSSR